MGSELTDKKTTKLTLTWLTNKLTKKRFLLLFSLYLTVLFGIYVCWIPQINAECQSKIIDVCQQKFLSFSLTLCSFLLTIWFFRFDWFSVSDFRIVFFFFLRSQPFFFWVFCLSSGSLLHTNWVCLNRKKEDVILNQIYKRNFTEKQINKSQLKLVWKHKTKCGFLNFVFG